MDLATLLGMPSNAAAMIGSGGDPEMSLPRGRTAPTTPRPVTPEVRRQAAHAARTGVMFGAGMLPVVGETMDAADLARAAQSRDMLGMLLSGGSLALPFLPGPSRWLDVVRGAPDSPGSGAATVGRGISTRRMYHGSEPTPQYANDDPFRPEEILVEKDTSDIHWYTDNRDHASYFGDVREFDLSWRDGDIIEFNLEDVPELSDLSSYEADEALARYIEERGAWGALIEGWEGPSGTKVLFLPDPSGIKASPR